VNAAPTTYEITVSGHLDDHWSGWLGGLDITRQGDGTTALSGTLADQAQLHGVLAGLRDIGATLRAVRTIRSDSAPARQTPDTPVLDRALRTERLTVRPATVDDADATWVFRQLDQVNLWLTGCPGDIDGYRHLFADPARVATTVVIQLGHDRDSQVIGDLMLRPQDAWAQLEVADQARATQAELGWVLDPAHTGHGYATEAVRALLRHSFDDLGVRRVIASCFLDNDASWRLMERIGMRRETHAVRESLHRSGRWLDTVGYALLADEWSDPAGTP
jgi:RimJ/RimL family protein N-acetyltransferase